MSAIEKLEALAEYPKTPSTEFSAAYLRKGIIGALSDLKREIEQDKRDAEMYREIKDGYQSGKEIEVHKRKYSFKLPFTNYEYEVFNSLDEAIDAAIAAKKDGV